MDDEFKKIVKQSLKKGLQLQIKSLVKVRANVYDVLSGESEKQKLDPKFGSRTSAGDFVHIPIKWNFILLVKETDDIGNEAIFPYEQGGPYGTLMSRSAIFFNEKAMNNYLNFFVVRDDRGISSGDPDQDWLIQSAFQKMRANYIKCDYDKFIWSA